MTRWSRHQRRRALLRQAARHTRLQDGVETMNRTRQRCLMMQVWHVTVSIYHDLTNPFTDWWSHLWWSVNRSRRINLAAPRTSERAVSITIFFFSSYFQC